MALSRRAQAAILTSVAVAAFAAAAAAAAVCVIAATSGDLQNHEMMMLGMEREKEAEDRQRQQRRRQRRRQQDAAGKIRARILESRLRGHKRRAAGIRSRGLSTSSASETDTWDEYRDVDMDDYDCDDEYEHTVEDEIRPTAGQGQAVVRYQRPQQQQQQCQPYQQERVVTGVVPKAEVDDRVRRWITDMERQNPIILIKAATATATATTTMTTTGTGGGIVTRPVVRNSSGIKIPGTRTGAGIVKRPVSRTAINTGVSSRTRSKTQKARR